MRPGLPKATLGVAGAAPTHLLRLRTHRLADFADDVEVSARRRVRKCVARSEEMLVGEGAGAEPLAPGQDYGQWWCAIMRRQQGAAVTSLMPARLRSMQGGEA